MNKNWKIIVAFVAVFLFGGVIGAVCGLRFAQRPVFPRPPLRPEQFDAQLMHRWMNARQLALTPEQKQRIRPIVFEAAESLRRLRRETLHSGSLIIEHMQDEIAALLNPEQRDRFNTMIQVQRERVQRFNQEQQRRAQEQQWRAQEQQRQPQELQRQAPEQQPRPPGSPAR